MIIKLAPINLTQDLASNKQKVLNAFDEVNAGDWVLFPECTLTGYFPDDDHFLKTVTPDDINAALSEIAETVKDKKCYCLIGTARPAENTTWYNSVALISPEGIIGYYDKYAVSDLDKRHFLQGDPPKVYEMGGIKFGVQICRDLVFPEQWQSLKKQGAQVIFHSNNALKSYDDVWEHIIFARAIENQLFVASVNNCAEPGVLTSYLASPAGKLLLAAERQDERVLSAQIDLIDHGSPY